MEGGQTKMNLNLKQQCEEVVTHTSLVNIESLILYFDLNLD